jgi:hypothetical protein
LNDWAGRIAAKLQASKPTPDQMVEALYRSALNRPPTPAETQVGVAMLGDRPDSAAASDLVWVVLTLPEFQLIR